MDIEYKEVKFDKYCPICKYGDGPEKDDICNECLEEGMNLETEKPINYTPKK